MIAELARGHLDLDSLGTAQLADASGHLGTGPAASKRHSGPLAEGALDARLGPECQQEGGPDEQEVHRIEVEKG
jgi:hypothetical protein